MKESKQRSIIKGLSYRAMATVATMGVTYAYTSDISSAVHIGLADFFVKLILYFANERVWARISWGYGANSKYKPLKKPFFKFLNNIIPNLRAHEA